MSTKGVYAYSDNSRKEEAKQKRQTRDTQNGQEMGHRKGGRKKTAFMQRKATGANTDKTRAHDNG